MIVVTWDYPNGGEFLITGSTTNGTIELKDIKKNEQVRFKGTNNVVSFKDCGDYLQVRGLKLKILKRPK